MPQVTKRPLNRIIFAFINCVKSATNTHRKSTRPSFNIKAQLRLNMCSSPGVLFWTNDQNLYPACVPPDVTLVRDTNQRSGVQNAIGVAHLNHMPATEDFLRHKISQPYSLFSGLSQKHPRLFFFMKNGLRNIRSGSKSRVWREEHRGCCCCCVSQRGSDPDDQGVVESYPGRHSQSWDYYVRQVSPFCTFPVLVKCQIAQNYPVGWFVEDNLKLYI